MTFSERHGFKSEIEPEITIRYDAPEELRGVIILLAVDAGISPNPLRDIICRCLLTRPDKNNWSDYPNINDENHRLLDDAAWYKVYDIVEAVASNLLESFDSTRYDKFKSRLNDYFVDSGIGWKLIEGKLEARNPEAVEQTIKKAVSSLSDSKMPTAKQELHEALKDLSKRPEPDITGSIQHSMAALECVLREVVGNQKSTLGELLKKYKGTIPAPLDQAVEKLWGFASEYGRHIKEGREPDFEEAQLVVGSCAALVTYLTGKNSTKKNYFDIS